MKKLLTGIMIAALLLTMLPVAALAEEAQAADEEPKAVGTIETDEPADEEEDEEPEAVGTVETDETDEPADEEEDEEPEEAGTDEPADEEEDEEGEEKVQPVAEKGEEKVRPMAVEEEPEAEPMAALNKGTVQVMVKLTIDTEEDLAEVAEKLELHYEITNKNEPDYVLEGVLDHGTVEGDQLTWGYTGSTAYVIEDVLTEDYGPCNIVFTVEAEGYLCTLAREAKGKIQASNSGVVAYSQFSNIPTITVVKDADWDGLQVIGTMAPGTAEPGEEAAYTITVTNGTGKALTGVKIAYTLDEGLDVGDGSHTGVWMLDLAADAAPVKQVMTVKIPADAKNRDKFENTAKIIAAAAINPASEEDLDGKETTAELVVEKPDVVFTLKCVDEGGEVMETKDIPCAADAAYDLTEEVEALAIKQYVLDRIDKALAGEDASAVEDTTVVLTYTVDDNEDGVGDKYQVTVTFQVVNGAWNSGETEDVVVLLTKVDEGGEQTVDGKAPVTGIPTVGTKADKGYRAGRWDTNPYTAETEEDATFTYTYEKVPPVVVPDDDDEDEDDEPVVPPTKPEEPGTPVTDPEAPGVDPENPGTDPENPGVDPENPGADPENPGTDPENPGADPENPGADPENPGVNPEDPGTGAENTGSENTGAAGETETPDEGNGGEEGEDLGEDLGEGDVPLVELPDDLTDLGDGDVPLAGLPEGIFDPDEEDDKTAMAKPAQTGDNLALLLMAAASAATALAWTAVSGKKREDAE